MALTLIQQLEIFRKIAIDEIYHDRLTGEELARRIAEVERTNRELKRLGAIPTEAACD
jgi:hypothetical protein